MFDRVLDRVNQTEQALTATHADRLVILHLVCGTESVVSLLQGSPAAEERFNPETAECLTIATWNSKAEAHVKGESEAHIRELYLRGEIGRLSDHPPSLLVGVYVPDIVRDTMQSLGVDLLKEVDSLVWCLRGKVVDDGLSLLIGRFEHLLSTAQRISFCPAGPVQKRSATAEAGPPGKTG